MLCSACSKMVIFRPHHHNYFLAGHRDKLLIRSKGHDGLTLAIVVIV